MPTGQKRLKQSGNSVNYGGWRRGPHFIYTHTHIHIICNYNSEFMMLRERRGVIKWGMLSAILYPPPLPVAPPVVRLSLARAPLTRGVPFSYVYHMTAQCTQIILMDRAKESVLLGGWEKKFLENIQKGRNNRAFSGTEFDAFLLFHSFKESFVLYCLFYVQFRCQFFVLFLFCSSVGFPDITFFDPINC